MRRVPVVLVGIACLAMLAFVVSHWFIQNDDAYAAADRHVRLSAAAVNEVGEIRTTGLAWFDHAAVNEQVINGKSSGNAEFAINVTGERGVTKVTMELTKDSSGWSVVRANFLPNPSFQRTATRPLN